MELEASYQLLGVLRDDGIRTYNAVEIASGQAMQVHLFAKPDAEFDRTLYKALRALPASKRRELLDIGMENDMPYIVTDKLPDTTSAREWLTKLAGLTMAPNKASGPVTLVGSWKTGTPIPEDLIRASHTSHPPKQPPAAKPLELGPDYTRVMRLPQTFSDMPLGPPLVGPPQTEALKAEAAAPKPEPMPVAVPEQPVVPEKAPGEADEFERMFRTAAPEPATPEPPRPASAEPAGQPGEFTRMFLANRPAETAPPAVPQPPPEPAVVQPLVAEPVAKKEPGEFTRMFRSSQAPDTTAPPVPPPPAEPAIAQPAIAEPLVAEAAAKEPGEFTRMFLAGQQQTAPPTATTIQPLQPAPPPPPLEPRQFSTAQAPTVKPPSEESTRVFQAFTPSAPPPPPINPPPPNKEPGEFTRMFPQARTDSPALSAEPTPPPQPHSDGPGEFTRFFQSPIYPTPGGNQKAPSAPQLSPQSTSPPASRSANQAGEFTQMFGNPNRAPDPWAAPAQTQPPPQPFGSPSSATGAFSIPKSSSFPPASKSSEPGEFTRMMAATAPPTLGQPANQPAVQPATKSMMPLYIGAAAVLLAIILVILFFVLRK